MHIDPRRLAVLLSVHRSGGIAAAAAADHLSASAVSQQIARLEAEAGVEVLDRRPGGVTLTDAGRVMVETAERLENELAEVRRTLDALGTGVSGTVIIGSIKTITNGLLIPLVEQVRESSPGVGVVVHETDGEVADRRLRNGELDVLVLEADSPTGRKTPSGMRDRPILDEQWRLLVPTGVTEPRSFADLATLTWLRTEERAAAHQATQRLLQSFPNSRIAPHRYDDYEVALAMVAGGLGVALAPEIALSGHVPAGVRVVSLPGLGTRRVVARVRASRADARPEIGVVLDLLGQVTS